MYCPAGFTDSEDGDGNIVEGGWRRDSTESQGLDRMGSLGGNRYGRAAADVRDLYRDYFSSTEGEISWQYHHVNRTGY